MTPKEWRYGWQRNGRRFRTRWYDDEEAAREAMARRIGHFHPPGMAAGDGDGRRDGGHDGCPRNGGLLWLDVR